MARKIPKWEFSIPAGESRRSPSFILDDFSVIRGFVKATGALKISLAMGREKEGDVPAVEAGSASLPYATAEGDIASTSGAETGVPFQIAIDGAPDVGQVVLRNPGGSTVTGTMMGGLDAWSV